MIEGFCCSRFLHIALNRFKLTARSGNKFRCIFIVSEGSGTLRKTSLVTNPKICLLFVQQTNPKCSKLQIQYLFVYYNLHFKNTKQMSSLQYYRIDCNIFSITTRLSYSIEQEVIVFQEFSQTLTQPMQENAHVEFYVDFTYTDLQLIIVNAGIFS